jgi:thiaminase (transcriptional activator TenA)
MSIERTTSANKMVTCLYSAGDVPAETAAPHSLQNFALSFNPAPHDPHGRSVAVISCGPTAVDHLDIVSPPAGLVAGINRRAGIIAGVKRDGWTGRLWAEAAGTYAAILRHPFLAGLTDGSLDPDLFSHYVVQDAHYLRDFARTLTVVGSKAPTHAGVGMFARHAANTAEVELALHESLLAELGIQNLDAMPVAPTTLAYTSYLLATAYRGTFADGLAAVLPCYWIYAEVGAELVGRGSPDPRYQRWINTYADDEYQTIVAEVLALTDTVGQTLSDAEQARARTHFATTARYEWMFWEAAWRGEGWPV